MVKLNELTHLGAESVLPTEVVRGSQVMAFLVQPGRASGSPVVNG